MNAFRIIVKLMNMKYLLFSIMSLFLFSCNDVKDTAIIKGDDMVRISAEFSNKTVTTRAVSIPVSHKLRCIIEVWTKGEKPALCYRKEVAVEAGEIPNFEFSLPNGNYECLMWADCIERNAEVNTETVDKVTYEHFSEVYYNTDDLHQVTIKEKTASNLFDTDLCDAFFARTDFKKGVGCISEKLKLQRPFAKLIVRENEEDKFTELKKMKVAYSVPRGFNVSTGEPLPTTLRAEYEKEFMTQCGDLFTNYIFVSSEIEYLGEMNLIFNTGTELRYNVKGGLIPMRRNEQICASGNLIASGVIKPDEPIGDPHIGDYFFIDGTWSSSLTDENKENCIGIVFEVGKQNGDEISVYGDMGKDRDILGYVMALKNIDRSPLELYSDGAERFVKTGLIEEEEIEKFNGYSNTSFLLDSEFYRNDSDLYPLLVNFQNWKKNVVKPVKNSSDWYIPSFNQLVKMIGYCYGYNNLRGDGREGLYYKKTICKNLILQEALNNAIAKGIAENIVWETRERPIVCSTVLNDDQKYFMIRYNPSTSFAFANKENPRGLLRPILTILK